MLLGLTLLLTVTTIGSQEPEPALPQPPDTIEPVEPTEDNRQAALEEFRRTGLLAAEATGGLLDFILKPDTPLDLRCRATLALGEVGLRNLEQADRLAALLDNPETAGQLRWTILMTFGENRVVAPIFRPVLLRIATDTSADLVLRRQAVFHLRNQEVTQDAAQAFAHIAGESGADLGLRTASLDGLRQATAGNPAVSVILSRMANDAGETLSLRQAAIQVLTTLGRDEEVVPALLAVVENPLAPTPLRLEAARALESFKVPQTEAERLASLLSRSETPLDLRRAIASLNSVHSRPLPGEPRNWIALLASTNHPVEVRRLALDSLIRSDAVDPTAIITCIELLQESDGDLPLRLAATDYLQARGPEAETARAVLETVVGDTAQPDPLRERSARVLAELSRAWLTAPEEQPSSTLVQRLRSLEATAALFSTTGLDTPELRRNLEAIRQVQAVLATEYRSRWWHRSTTWMIRHPWSTAGIVAIVVVILLLLARAATVTLAAHRPAATPLASPPPADPPHLAHARNLAAQVLLPDNPDRAQAIETLAALGPDATPALSLLAEALRNIGHEVEGRYGALQTLMRLREVAGASQPALLDTVNDPTEYLFLRIHSLDLLATVFPCSRTSSAMLERLTDPQEPELLRLRAGHTLLNRLAPSKDALPKLSTMADSLQTNPLRDLAAKIRANWTTAP